jgi:hypothetical protein
MLKQDSFLLSCQKKQSVPSNVPTDPENHRMLHQLSFSTTGMSPQHST